MLAICVLAAPLVTYAQSCKLPKQVSRLDESRRIFYVEADLSQIDTPTKAIKFLTPLEEFTTKCRNWRQEWETMFFHNVDGAYSKTRWKNGICRSPTHQSDGTEEECRCCGYERTSGLSDHRGPRSIPRIAPALKYLPC